MDYEKKYKDALERASKLKVQNPFDTVGQMVEHIFSELKESEEERIKKALIKILNEIVINTNYKELGIDYNIRDMIAWLEKQESYYTFEIKEGHWYKCVCDYMLNDSDLMFKNDSLYYCRRNWRLTGEIDERNVKDIGVNGYKSFFRPATNQEIKDWLEKQGEKKPTDEVEPKFKVGNWYQCTKDFFGKGVTFDKNTAYYCAKEGCLQNEYGCHIAIVKDLYDNFKLWTIEDANDGDVLDCEGCEYLLFKSFSNTDGRIKLYCWYNVQTNSFHGRGTDSKLRQEANIHPATKEQCDLLFQKMKEAGYEWDADKKELKKIGPKKLKVINWVNPDKVIEWLTANVRLYASLNFPYGSGCPQGDVEVESLLKAFKKDFGL